LQREHGRIREARDLLTSVYSRFGEGFGTADLQRQNGSWAGWAEPGTSRLS
jgi:hypothetical protein